MSVDLSGEITAIATAVLALFAIVTAYYARKAFLKQSEQLDDQRKINELQASELSESLAERKRQAAVQRRVQVSRIFMWTVHGLHGLATMGASSVGADRMDAVNAHIRNTSSQPIYDLTIFWHRGTAPWVEPTLIGVLMPDDQINEPQALPAGLPATVDRSLFSAVARFRDAAGVRWLIRPDGHFSEEPQTGSPGSAQPPGK